VKRAQALDNTLLSDILALRDLSRTSHREGESEMTKTDRKTWCCDFLIGKRLQDATASLPAVTMAATAE
jgi:hypothetical protein